VLIVVVNVMVVTRCGVVIMVVMAQHGVVNAVVLAERCMLVQTNLATLI
jgi:hypothetical protein